MQQIIHLETAYGNWNGNGKRKWKTEMETFAR